MRLEASIALGAGEERIEREDGPIRNKDGALKFGGPGSGRHKSTIVTEKGTYRIRGPWTSDELKKQHESFVTKYKSTMPFDRWLVERGKVYFKLDGAGQGGWQYGFRHPEGYIPTRTLSGFPKTGSHGGGVPAIPKGPGVARKPNPSLGRSVKGPGMKFPNPSLSRLRSKSEAAEPPETGAYAYHQTEQDKWFNDPGKKVKAGGPGSGRHKTGEAKEPVKVPPKANPLQRDFVPTKVAVGNFTPEQIKNFLEVHRKRAAGELEADFEPTMQHAHLATIDTFHPPSLVKRGLQDHTPTDDPGETDDKFFDVTKRNSKGTWEERMKLLKRSAPGGLPAQIPARTTLIPMHQGAYLPSAMMSAQKPRLKQRPVNWDKQPRQRTSYARRGSI